MNKPQRVALTTLHNPFNYYHHSMLITALPLLPVPQVRSHVA
jgi:hypothetical protein